MTAPADVEALVERLHFEADEYADSGWIEVPRLLREAASALLRIAEENRRLREALNFYASTQNWKAILNSEATENQTVHSSWLRVSADIGTGYGPALKDSGEKARAALGETTTEGKDGSVLGN